MKWWFIIMVLLSGCAAKPVEKQPSQPPKPSKKVGIISSLGDDLLCTYTGLTVFSNEEQRYTLPSTFNELFIQQVKASLPYLPAQIIPLKREQLRYEEPELNASIWENIYFDNSQGIDTLIILAGSFHYKSKEGFYASDNGLHTRANMYVYEVETGVLLRDVSQFRLDLKKEFACNQPSIAADDEIYELIKQASKASQPPLIEQALKVIKS